MCLCSDLFTISSQEMPTRKLLQCAVGNSLNGDIKIIAAQNNFLLCEELTDRINHSFSNIYK